MNTYAKLRWHLAWMVLCLLMAAYAWYYPPSSQAVADPVVLTHWDSRHLTNLTYHSRYEWVQLIKQDKQWWLAYHSFPQAQSNDANQPATLPSVDANTLDAYPLNERGQEVLRKLLPLRAMRYLGSFDANRLAEFGLRPTPALLQLSWQDHTNQSFAVGAGAYGSGDYYITNNANAVYLLRNYLLTPLSRSANLLQDKQAVAVRLDNLTDIAVATDGKETLQHFSLVDQNHSNRAAAKALAEQALRLRVVDLRQTPPARAFDLKLQFQQSSGQTDWLEVWQPQAGHDGHTYGRSSRFSTAFTLPPYSVDPLLAAWKKLQQPNTDTTLTTTNKTTPLPRHLQHRLR